MSTQVVVALDQEIEQVERKLQNLKTLKAEAVSILGGNTNGAVKHSTKTVSGKRRGRPPGAKASVKSVTTAKKGRPPGSKNKKTKGKYDWKQAIYIAINEAGEEGLVLADMVKALRKNKDFKTDVGNDIEKFTKNTSVHLHNMKKDGTVYKGEEKKWFITDGIELEIPGYNVEEAAAA